MAQGLDVPLLLLGWLIAAVMRIAVGSATVAVTTAAGMVSSLAAGTETSLELLVIAMGAGSLILSHVNDGGFWFVKEYFGMSVSETLRTWTVLETVIAVLGLVFVVVLDWVV
jgi:GntP family gluconate:H+ symporter